MTLMEADIQCFPIILVIFFMKISENVQKQDFARIIHKLS